MSNEKDKKQDEQEEARFDVILSIDIQRHNQEGGRKRFFQSDVQYYALDYAAVVGIEHLMLGVLNKLGEAGVKVALTKGVSNKSLLTVLGIVPDKD